jgi:hypothetical protein
MPETATLITSSGVSDVDTAPDSLAPTFTSNDSSPVSDEQEPLDENNESTLPDSKEDQATILVESRGEEEDDEEQPDLELSLPPTDQPDVWPRCALLSPACWPIPVSSVRSRPATMGKPLPRLEASGYILGWLTIVLIFMIVLASVFGSFFVVASNGKKQAKLNANPRSLDFGTLAVGKQAVQVVTVSNVGTQPLSGTADTGGTSWLKLDTTTGTIQILRACKYCHSSLELYGSHPECQPDPSHF